MSTDKAFDNLMQKKALSIPVARRDSATEPIPYNKDVIQPPHPGQAMRVDLVDDRPGDYHPSSDDPHDSERRLYTHPTETDLEPVEEDTVPVSEESMHHHTRFVGRDVDDDFGEYRRDEYDSDTEKFSEANEVIESSEHGLEHARRVPRFAYLPLAGMDSFESHVRDLSTNLASSNPECPSLAIASQSRGEGRTELAIRIALALAKRVGYRVLLADMDVRKPAIAARLGLSTKYFTMADVLRGSCQLGEALVVSEEDELYVLPARPIDRDGDEILDSRQVETMLDTMHQAFDFVVLDCGPAAQADTLVVCRQAGAVALAGRCNQTLAAAMRQTGKTLSAAGANVAGMLITGA